MDELLAKYQEIVYSIQKLNRRLAHYRAKLSEEEQHYRVARAKAKRENSKSQKERVNEIRLKLNRLAGHYKMLVDDREELENLQQAEKEKLIARDINPAIEEGDGRSEELLLLKNFYEALRKGEDALDEIENLLAKALPSKPERFFGRHRHLNDLPSQEVFDEDHPFELLKSHLRIFSVEVEDIADLGINLITDIHHRDEFWPLFYAMELDLKNNQPTDSVLDKLFSLRHRIEVILLDLETHKDHLELDVLN